MSNNPFESIDPIARQGKRSSRVLREFNFSPEEIPSLGSSSTLSRPGERVRTRLFIGIVLIVLGTLLSRAFYLQVIQSHSYRNTAERNRTESLRVTAPRGDIITSDSVVVANNIASFSLLLDTAQLTKTSTPIVVAALEETLKIPSEEINSKITEAKKARIAAHIKDDIPYSDALDLMVALKAYPSLQLTQQYSRQYPLGSMFAQIIGYTSKMNAADTKLYQDEQYALDDIVGKSGIERSYETKIHGSDGIQKVEVDFKGNPQRVVTAREPEAGQTIRLTIDSSLQKLLTHGIAKVVDEKKIPGGSAVAIDPRDGSVRAMVSYPSYDNNAFTGGISTEEYTGLLENPQKPLLNRTITGEYPSGSTFKTIVAAAGLAEGVITSETTVSSTGGLKVGPYIFPDWKAGGHGVTDVKKALAESVNTFFYLLGGGDNSTSTGLGVERIVSYARKFGLASKTGIDIAGERPGFLPSKAWKEEVKNEPWYLGDTYHLAIGQGDILITPLQAAVFTATIANGGTYYQPHLLQSTIDPKTQVEKPFQTVVKNPQVVQRDVINIVRDGMRESVTAGSSRSLGILPVTSAGKTGTAQFGSKGKTQSWFVAFAPFENPEIAIAIMIEEGGGANDTAVPIAREALKSYFTAKLAK